VEGGASLQGYPTAAEEGKRAWPVRTQCSAPSSLSVLAGLLWWAWLTLGRGRGACRVVKLLAVAATVVGASKVLAGHTPPAWLRQVLSGGSPTPQQKQQKATATAGHSKRLIAPHKR
jgi:hypothetical protein